MKILSKLYETKLVPHIKKTLANTHARMFLDVLNEYDRSLCEMLYYGTICLHRNALLIGTEYQYEKYEFTSAEEAQQAYEELVCGSDGFRELLELYREANTAESSNIFIPVSVNEKRIFCVCSDNKKALLEYLGINCGGEIYEDYPLLVQILQWGIPYILAEDVEQQMQEEFAGYAIQSDKEFQTKASMVEYLFKKLELPYMSTVTLIASWNYEGQANSGYIDFLNPIKDQMSDADMQVIFDEAVTINRLEARTIRKYLELSSKELHIKASSCSCYISGALLDDDYWQLNGLGHPEESIYATIQFEGNCRWRLLTEREIVAYDGVTYHFGRKNQEKPLYQIRTEHYFGKMESMKKIDTTQMCNVVISLIDMALAQTHGTLLVFSEKAKEEANRLCGYGRGIKIQPIDCGKILKENFEELKRIIRNITKIDGAVLFDFDGTCYAIGVILDGKATKASNIGRGARFNSAMTYVCNCSVDKVWCYGAVISEDGTIDVTGSVVV